jgi:hypothetical protein
MDITPSSSASGRYGSSEDIVRYLTAKYPSAVGAEEVDETPMHCGGCDRVYPMCDLDVDGVCSECRNPMSEAERRDEIAVLRYEATRG